MKKRTRILMASPEFFRIEYAINPYMMTAGGELRRVDVDKAKAQWNRLRTTYESLGFTVDVIPGHPELPDMVFAANQSFTYWDSVSARPKAILSRMRSEFRQPEVAHFKRWYEENDYLVEEISCGACSRREHFLHQFPHRAVIGKEHGQNPGETLIEVGCRNGLGAKRLVCFHPFPNNTRRTNPNSRLTISSNPEKRSEPGKKMFPSNSGAGIPRAPCASLSRCSPV